MDNWLSFVAIIASFVTFLGFIGIFIKLGRDKGASEVYMKEMAKDIEKNHQEIESLKDKINKQEVDNVRLMTTLSNDLAWIKNSLVEIKDKIEDKNTGNSKEYKEK